VTLPGVPAPVITPHLTREDSRRAYAAGTEFAMDVIALPGNTGTYLDSPWHRYADGADLAGLDLASLVDIPAEVFHLTELPTKGIPAEVFAGRELRGRAVLLHTGWDRHFGTPEYAVDPTYLSAEGVAYLAEQGAALVGIDSINIDLMVPGGERPAHTVFLGAGIHVVEHLANLGALPESGALFTAAPPAIEGFGTFPVRAYATLG
jgi:arylformamidase